MKLHAVVCAILALSLSMGGPVFAQGDGDIQQQRKAQRQVQRMQDQQRRQDHGPQQRPRGWDQSQRQRGYDQQDRGRDERREGYYYNAQQFRRGDRLPPEYRHPNYVVDDWRGHRLSAPPRGYHWVQVGTDYVLVAIATGIILQLLLNN